VEAYAKANQVIGSGDTPREGSMPTSIEKCERLLVLVTQLVSSILKTQASKLPATLRYVCKHIHQTLVLQIAEAGHQIAADESQALLQLVVSHLLGVRFFSLGLTCPALFLLPEPRSEFSQDSLITLSNILLGLMGITNLKFDSTITSPLHIHVSEFNSEYDAFYSVIHKHKALAATHESLRSQLMNWLTQVADFNDLQNKPTGPLAYFALETCGSMLGRWLCENALDFILACPNPLEHQALYEFMAANKPIILQLDAERSIFQSHMVLGPGIWNAVTYGRAWNVEVKLPDIRTQDMFVWIPTSLALASPSSNKSTLDWILKYSTNSEFLLLIICPSTSKISASVVRTSHSPSFVRTLALDDLLSCVDSSLF